MDKIMYIVIICVAVFAVLLIILMAVANFLYDFAINARKKKTLVKNNEICHKEDEHGFDLHRWVKDSSEGIYITSRDGLKLFGRLIRKNGSRKCAVICHGYTAPSYTIGDAAKKFYDMGYNVFLPTARGHYESQGDYIGMGWDERFDIIDWMKELEGMIENVSFILYGESMGAATVMCVCGEDLPDNVILAIEDCGYSCVYDQFKSVLITMFHLPAFPVLEMANFISRIRAGYDFRDASPINQIKKCKIPVLFIHGKEDKFVPADNCEKLYNAAKCEKEILMVDNANHAQSRDTAPELYWNRVSAFIKKYEKDAKNAS